MSSSYNIHAPKTNISKMMVGGRSFPSEMVSFQWIYSFCLVSSIDLQMTTFQLDDGSQSVTNGKWL